MLKRIYLLLSISVLAAFFITTDLQAQTKVTFNVHMQRMLADSVFIPGKHVLKLSGDIFPLGFGREQIMRDTEPIDSVYSATVTISAGYTGDVLRYNFLFQKENETETERQERTITLRGTEMELTAVFFNAFAW